MKRSEEEEFRQYVVVRMERLRRSAYLLCRDWYTADDLVAVTIGKLYRSWRKAQQADRIDAYVQKILLRAWLDELRRPWRREQATAELPPDPVHDRDTAERMVLLDMLAALTPRRRAAVVLRFYCDLSVDEAAEVLGCSAGTVKSLTARGLEALRARVGANTVVPRKEEP